MEGGGKDGRRDFMMTWWNRHPTKETLGTLLPGPHHDQEGLLPSLIRWNWTGYMCFCNTVGSTLITNINGFDKRIAIQNLSSECCDGGARVTDAFGLPQSGRCCFVPKKKKKKESIHL